MVIFSPFVGIFVYAGYLVMTTNPEQFSLLERGILLGVIVFVTAAFLFLIVFILYLLPCGAWQAVWGSGKQRWPLVLSANTEEALLSLG
jgi:hypothetical protein